MLYRQTADRELSVAVSPSRPCSCLLQLTPVPEESPLHYSNSRRDSSHARSPPAAPNAEPVIWRQLPSTRCAANVAQNFATIRCVPPSPAADSKRMLATGSFGPEPDSRVRVDCARLDLRPAVLLPRDPLRKLLSNTLSPDLIRIPTCRAATGTLMAIHLNHTRELRRRVLLVIATTTKQHRAHPDPPISPFIPARLAIPVHYRTPRRGRR
jgi:hypothetical protein